jgi:predicted metalloprotease with PDZ domain
MRNLTLILAAAALLLPGLARGAEAEDEGKGWLGVLLAHTVEMRDGETSKEVRIVGVFEDSPAERAGLQKGDVILRVDGAEVGEPGEIAENLGSRRPGQRVNLRVLRDGEEMRVRVRLGERPDDIEKQYAALTGDKRILEKFLQPGEGGEFAWHAMPGAKYLAQVYARPGGPIIGVRIETLTEQLAGFFGVDGGVLITEVIAGTPAEKAGLLAGDVVTAAGGEPVRSAGDLQKAIHENGTDTPIRIEVMRRGQRLTFDTTPEGKAKQHSSCCPKGHGECCPHGHGAKAFLLGEDAEGHYHMALQEALEKMEGLEIDVETIQESTEKAFQEALESAAAAEDDVKVMKRIHISPGETI